MRGQFTSVFVFDAHVKVHNCVFAPFFYLIFINLFPISTLALAFLQCLKAKRDFFPKARHVSEVLSSCDKIIAKTFSFLKCFQNQRLSFGHIKRIVVVQFLLKFCFGIRFFKFLFVIFLRLSVLAES